MKRLQLLKIGLITFLLAGCVSEFLPETGEDQELLVVEALVTNQNEAYTVKVSKSLPLGRKEDARPVRNCNIIISDDLGHNAYLHEQAPGTYVTSPGYFTGVVGRKYTLNITTFESGSRHYQSMPVEMKPVPPIDSIYYEKRKLVEKVGLYTYESEGAQIYLDALAREEDSRFYRWEFEETWQFRLPYLVPNSNCWISENSGKINIKNTSAYSRNEVKRFPLQYISNKTDRLKVKYSILVKQYSLSEEEYTYWERLENISEQVGSLYDMIPSSVPSNIFCVNDPTEKVLGYFSISACETKRIFIKDYFKGIINLYSDCVADTIWNLKPIPEEGTNLWVIARNEIPPPSYQVITYIKGCYDCTVRGTKQEPDFWRTSK